MHHRSLTPSTSYTWLQCTSGRGWGTGPALQLSGSRSRIWYSLSHFTPCLWADHHTRECQLYGVVRESDVRHRSSRTRSSTNCQSSGPVGSLLITSPEMTRRTDMTYFTSLRRIKWEIVHICEIEKAFSKHKGLSSHPGYRRYFLYVP